MFLLVEFKFMDYGEPTIKFFAEYLAILGLFAAIGYYVKYSLQKISAHRIKKRKKAKEETGDRNEST